ncbi:vWA domain-containing protein [Vibrio fluvialis]|uniref:vWA domain-containing protein n=1 Tax=Vibrio fluvialis TaxID=676 RepID=UPI00192BC95C|nr:VWA domain-containing protein [Vibrio fluvialis]MBL4240194.1 VWA domain-containing protein [Vibrio fluvialis]MBL4266337.1 VWA domain-containing protein [Vibrio fluvialis]MBL4268903.1 VWA domain-containing protein [Vibrio fluvialis]MBL4275205.1 VWA domain-containing protein [Vibrio fluvialis]MBO1439210.1 VWA domain-containing protein [Vibrio fluvialis]
MANIEFVWWWLFVLVPLPLIVYRFLPQVKERAAIQLPYLPQQNQAIAPRQWLAKTLVIALWLCLVTAAARPVWYGEPVTTSPKHRDMMLVVDLSYSMSQQDMKSGDQFIDRLSAVKQVLSDFIAKRQGDRLGLIFFADHAYLQTPLTLDRQTIAQQLNQAVLRLIGTKTAIGEGIGLATKTFIDSDAPQRVMILLSDGSNTSGVLDPMEAAKIAKKYHTTIYTVGVGAGEMMVKEFFMTRKVNTAEDLDEKTLQAIAKETGGQYFRARNQQDLQHIYDTINQLEPISKASQTWRPQSEWFGYPLALALLLSVILMLMRRNHV